MEYQLIPMEEKHLLTLAALERICFSDPWSENAFRAELDNPGARFTVAQDGAGTVLGYLGLHYVLDEGYIANIAVDPLFRRQGILHKKHIQGFQRLRQLDRVCRVKAFMGIGYQFDAV